MSLSVAFVLLTVGVSMLEVEVGGVRCGFSCLLYTSYCLHCARELHIKPVDDLMKQFGMSDQDLDNMENRMESMMEEMGCLLYTSPASATAHSEMVLSMVFV